MGLTTPQWGGSVLYIETQGKRSKLDADGVVVALKVTGSLVMS
jgi:hypothetical protein